jgi:hypothetical protein
MIVIMVILSHRDGLPKARFADQRKALQLSPKQADIDFTCSR